MTNILRGGAAVLLFGAGWAFSSFVATNRAPGASSYFGGKGSETPVPDAASGKANTSLSSTAIGRLIDGKTDFRRQASLNQYAESLDAGAMTGAINEAMQLPLK
jgi:hypothetical protein